MKLKQLLKISVLLNISLLIVLGYNYKEILAENFKNQDQKYSIVFFGDSIIEEGNWSELLERKDVKKRGFRGFTTSQYRWIIKDSVLVYNPEICVISGGINDIGSGIPMKRIKLNYKKLLETLVTSNVTPVVQSTLYQENNPKSKVLVDSLNNFLVNYCRENGIKYLDINSKLSSTVGLKPEFSKDGTHLTKEAYIIWIDEISRALAEIES